MFYDCNISKTMKDYEQHFLHRIRVLYSKASGKQRLDTKGNRRVRAAVNHAP
jgi:hypothetical protein